MNEDNEEGKFEKVGGMSEEQTRQWLDVKNPSPPINTETKRDMKKRLPLLEDVKVGDILYRADDPGGPSKVNLTISGKPIDAEKIAAAWEKMFGEDPRKEIATTADLTTVIQNNTQLGVHDGGSSASGWQNIERLKHVLAEKGWKFDRMPTKDTL